MVIWTVPLQNRTQRNSVNFTSYTAFRDRLQTLESVGAITGSLKNLGAEKDGALAERISGWSFTPAVFQALGVKPARERLYTDAEDQIDNWAPVIVITHRPGNGTSTKIPMSSVRTLTLDQNPVTVIGVLAKTSVSSGTRSISSRLWKSRSDVAEQTGIQHSAWAAEKERFRETGPGRDRYHSRAT